MQYHPDRNPSKDAEATFKRIQLAYSLIKTASGRAMVRKVAQQVPWPDSQQQYEEGPSSPPNPTGRYYGSSRDFDRPDFGTSPFSADEYGDYTGSYTSASFFEVIYEEFVLKLMLSMEVTRIPLQATLLIPISLYFFSITSETSQMTLFEHVQGILFGFIMALISDTMIFRMLTEHRSLMRERINNRTGYLIIFSGMYLLFVAITGSRDIPLFLELFYSSEPNVENIPVEVFVSAGVYIFCSATYFWFCYCLLFQTHRPFYDRVFMLFWAIATLYYFIVYIQFRL